MVETNHPVEMSYELMQEALSWGAKGSIQIGAIYKTASKGEIWPDNKGEKRLIVSIYTGKVYFMIKDKGYCQSAQGFAGDVGVGNIAHRTAAGMAAVVKFIEIEMAFLQGFLCALAWPLMVAFTGKDIVEFIIKNRKKIPKWIEGGKKFLLGWAGLKMYSPTLYDVIFSIAAFDFVRKIVTAPPPSPTAAQTAKAVAGVMGGLMKLAVAQGLQWLLTLGGILSKCAVAAAKDIIGRVEKQYSNVEEVVATLKDAGAKSVTNQQANQIIKEYLANRTGVQTALKDLHEAVQIICSKTP
jgi:hypothetical protein